MTPSSLAAGAKRPAFLMTAYGAVAAMFFIFGIGVGLWSGASATILAHAGVNAPLFGVGMTAYIALYLAAMSSGGLLIGRFGLRKVLLAGAVLQGASVAWLLLSDSANALFPRLVLFGAFAGLVDLTMNAEGARVEKELKRPVLAGLHGGASAGSGVGAIVGSLIAVNIGSWLSALIACVVFAGVTLLVLVATPERGVERALEAPSGRGALFTRMLVVLGIVLGISIASESAALSWSALLLQTEAPTLAAVAGLGAAFFCFCQAAFRLNADRIRTLVSDQRLIVVSLAVAALGFLIVASRAGFVTSVFGFAVIGMGTAAVVPCGFALAASHRGFSTAAALSTVALCGALARVPAPLAMGAIADYFSLADAFGLFAALLALAVGAMYFLVRDEPVIAAPRSLVSKQGPIQ